MKKKLIFEVEEGNTICDYNCPIYDACTGISGSNLLVDLCNKYDLSTLRLIEEEENDENKI